ncbi:MAG TPA: hypothetical protein VMY59_07625 [Candidatus Thermoplasmatota archaeon]|nr:hypothetical protein [Candidatus Thermoplasmatota archaeon]
MRNGIVAFVGMLGVLILLIVAFMGPWYTMNGTGTFGGEYTVGFYLRSIEAKGSITGQDISWSMGYVEAEENAQIVGVNTQSFSTIENAMYLTMFAMATALISLIGMAAFVFRLGTLKIMKYIGGGFGFLTFLLALMPALYVMTTGFSESSSDFWFSQSVLGVAITGGPGYAWYLMIVVSIIALISSVALLHKKITTEEALVEKAGPPANK